MTVAPIGKPGGPRRKGPKPMRAVLPCLILAATAVPATAAAQDTDTAIQQAQPPAREDVGVSQLVEPSGATRSVPQVGTPERGGPASAQLTAEPRSTRVGGQLSTGAASAREPTAISRPIDGRVGGAGTVARVEGADRCAPDATGDRPDVCDSVIETRSAQFARPERPTFSPEQRLLVDQRVREAPLLRGARDRRFDPRATDPDRADDQAIAAMALDRAGADAALAAADQAGRAPAVPEAAAALIEVILNNAGAQAPR
ncbi:hypothetical protein [uncultured Sphingomonas sp.]|uniref:hypothetical protein n=1 Tax=uncultured Sphingomonas sp. TaxID=158754 RepID=UPI0035C95673